MRRQEGGMAMTKSVLDGSRILAVDDEPDILTVLSEEILGACPDCRVHKATSYEQAVEKLDGNDYDVVILDIMGVRGFDLLQIAVDRGFNTVMLTAKALTLEALQQSHDLGARAFLPKDKLGEIVPLLEDVLSHEHKTAWQRILKKMEDYWDERFSDDWRKKFPYYE
jgi:CheY-like chemotaxis protein